MPEDSRIGTTIGSFRIESLIGRGGMGVVYLAEQDYPRRRVALKVLAPEIAADEGFRQRFVRESNTAAAIEHPNIIPIYAAGEADGLLFIAMRYIDGVDLGSLIAREGRLDPARALRITGQIGRALDAAHEEGLIHRDVKPGNILVARPRGSGGIEHTYLADFGLTKRTTSQTGLTATGMFMGTVDYVAPEQIRGEAVGGPADQYALACVLYHCLTGETPFRKDADIAVITAHLMDPPPRASAVRPELPGGLDDVLAKAMAKDPNERYPSCAEFAEAARRGCGVAPLGPAPTVVAGPPAGASPTVVPAAGTEVAPETAVPSTPETAPPPPAPTAAPPAAPTVAPPRPPRAPRGRRRRIAALALGALALGGVGAALWLLLGDGEPPGGDGGGGESVEAKKPLFSPDGRHIAFEGLDGSILVMEIDSGAVNVLDSAGADVAWFPDGGRVAYSAAAGGIMAINVDGTERTTVTDFGAHPTWSPGGTEIAFEDVTGIYVVDAAGGEPDRIREFGVQPVWAPDGRFIAFAEREGGTCVVKPNSRGGKCFTPSGVNPSWHPASKTYVFEALEGGISLVKLSDERVPLTEFGKNPVFNPDGDLIAFEEPGGGIFTVDLNGETRQLSDDGSNPSWTTDGERVVFDDGTGMIFTVKADGTETPTELLIGLQT